MIIVVSGFKGGVAKTTTALHLAGFLSTRGRTLLVDADANRSAIDFKDRGDGLPFDVMAHKAATRHVARYEYVVLDMPGNPDEDDLLEVASGADLMVLPTIPDAMSYEPIRKLEPHLRGANYRVLITIAPTPPEKDGEASRDALRAAGVPVFETIIHRRAALKHAANNGELVQDGEYEQLGLEVMRLVG